MRPRISLSRLNLVDGWISMFSLSFFISSFFPRFFRKNSFFFLLPLFRTREPNPFLGGGGEEDRGLSFLTTSWKSRFLNRRVEFFFSFSLFIFISLSFHSQLLSDIWVSGESLTKLHESIYIEIIFSTR